MDISDRLSFSDLISDLNTLTTIAQANVFTKDVAVLAVGESRPAAVLYLDIVNFSNLTAQLPTENLTMLIDRIFRIFELSVKSYGGYCDKVIGDAGLYVFPGNPAHPPAIEGALRAGLVLLERAQQLNYSLESQGIEFYIRIGVAFGDVTRERIGGDTLSYTVMGNTVNLAQRLEASADKSTLQVLPELVQSVGDLFDFQPVGNKELKNIGIVPVFKVVGLNERVYQFRTSGAYLSKLVGRDKELGSAINTINSWLNIEYPKSSLDITVADSIPKRNRLVVIKGSMAIGKSRLAYEIQKHFVAAQNVNVTTAHCLPNNMLDHFAAELVRIANINAENLPERWEELCAFAEDYLGIDYANRQRKHLNLLALFLNCPRIDTSSISKIDPQSFVFAVQLAFCAACELIGIFTGKPVFVVIEDIHWLSSYEKMFANIIKNAALKQPIVFIATTRPEHEQQIERYREICECLEIELNPISAENGRELITHILPGATLPNEVWSQIEDKADGIPYYYEEFARMLVRRGYLVDDDGMFKLVRELSQIELPDDIHMLILGKLDQLEPSLKVLVSKASVLGRGFIAQLLVEIERRLSDGEPENMPKMLQQLVLSDVFIEEIENDKYYFRHIVTQESAYKAMLERNKWLLHSLAADILDSMIVSGSKSERELLVSLLFHLEFIGKYKEAHIKCTLLLKLFNDYGISTDIDFWRAKAESLYTKAKSIDNSLPDQSPWILSSVDSIYLRRIGKFDEALAAANLAIDDFKKLNDIKGLASSMNNAALIYKNIGDYSNAEEYYIKALEIVDKNNSIALQSIYENLGNLIRLKGDFEKAIEYFNKAIEINIKTSNNYGLASVTSAIAHIWVERKNFGIAKQYYLDSLRVMQEINNFRGITTCLSGLGLVCDYCGEHELASNYYNQALVNLKQLNNVTNIALILNNLGLNSFYQNNYEVARNYYMQCLSIYKQLGDKRGVSVTLNNIGYFYIAIGKYDEAFDYLCQSLNLKIESGDKIGEISTFESLTQLMIEKKDYEKAVEYCKTGEQLAIENKDRWNLAFFAADWAIIHYQQNQPETASEYLNKARLIASELKTTEDSELNKHIAKAVKAIQV